MIVDFQIFMMYVFLDLFSFLSILEYKFHSLYLSQIFWVAKRGTIIAKVNIY